MPFAAFPLLLSTAAAVCASAPLPPPPSNTGGCTLHTSLNKIHWVDEETLRGTDKQVRWRNDDTREVLTVGADEGGYIGHPIPDHWVQAWSRGMVVQLDGSRTLSRALYRHTSCLSCSDGTAWGSCSRKSVEALPLSVSDEAVP